LFHLCALGFLLRESDEYEADEREEIDRFLFVLESLEIDFLLFSYSPLTSLRIGDDSLL